MKQLEVARAKVGDAALKLVGEPRASKDSDQLYYLARSPLRYLPLTPLQARRVNGALGSKRNPSDWLSPRQLELASELEQVDKKRLAGLERPASIPALVGYEVRLRKQLAQTDK